jgi:hypothetical protein
MKTYVSSLSMGILVYFCSLVPALGMDDGGRILVAKLTPDTPVTLEAPAAAFDMHNPKVKAVMAVQNRHTRDLMAIPEVVGTATGLNDTGKPVVLVFTRSEVPPGLVPSELDGVPAVVRVTGEIVALKPPGGGSSGKGGGFSTTAVLPPPVPIGVSTGNDGECSAGTIGARVVSGSTVYALSNNHVYALENSASPDSHVLQPGLYDTQCVSRGNNDLGTLAKYVTIKFNNTSCDPAGNTSQCNTVDAAIAATTIDMLGNATPPNGYGIPSNQTVSPSVGLAVQKYGRTTSLTKGTITGINGYINVSYGTGKNALFINQIVISSGKPFSKAGDSGSLIVTNDDHANPVGLLFAGGGGTTIANPIASVLGDLGVTIDGTTR